MPRSKSQNLLVILVLGSLTALGPFSVDMYLPAFAHVAEGLGTTVARVSFSLSSYFVGLAIGQLAYGPLLDRFGRKRPLAAGLLLYVGASLICATTTTITSLVAWRFAQALGGCVAGTAAFAWVRDLFETRDSAKVLSLLVLVLAVSPLIAPTFGGYVAAAYGWRSIFLVLPLIALLMLLTATTLLPAGRAPDRSVVLSARAIWARYRAIHRDPVFSTHAWAGAISFAGLFAYVAGSPALFMDAFHVDGATYGLIFASLSTGVIGAIQLNLLLLKRYRNETILFAAIGLQTVVSLVFLGLALGGLLNLSGTVVLLFIYLACLGLGNPNAQALALAPFAASAGTAAALMGSIGMTVGAAAAMSVGVLDGDALISMVSLLAAFAVAAFLTLLKSRRVQPA